MALESPKILDLSEELCTYACVAVLLKGPLDQMEIGYIQRADHPEDRWSGQIAFPGGKKETSDMDDYATVVRETSEEIGLVLDRMSLVGRLDDVQARKAGQLLNFYIRPFVFYIESPKDLLLDPNEVADFFWIPLSELKSPQRKTTYRFLHDALRVEMPAINLDKHLPLWGLTHFMTLNLLERLSAQFEMSNSSTP